MCPFLSELRFCCFLSSKSDVDRYNDDATVKESFTIFALISVQISDNTFRFVISIRHAIPVFITNHLHLVILDRGRQSRWGKILGRSFLPCDHLINAKLCFVFHRCICFHLLTTLIRQSYNPIMCTCRVKGHFDSVFR